MTEIKDYLKLCAERRKIKRKEELEFETSFQNSLLEDKDYIFVGDDSQALFAEKKGLSESEASRLADLTLEKSKQRIIEHEECFKKNKPHAFLALKFFKKDIDGEPLHEYLMEKYNVSVKEIYKWTPLQKVIALSFLCPEILDSHNITHTPEDWTDDEIYFLKLALL